MMEKFKVTLFFLVTKILLNANQVIGIDNRGSEFWLAVPPNKIAGERNEFTPLFYVTTDEDTPVPFIVRFRLTGTPTSYMATKGEIVKIEVPDDLKINHANLVGQGNDMSILINSTDGRNLIVYGHNEEVSSTDAFLALPKFETKNGTYEYYAMSVGDSEQFEGKLVGFVVIVINEDNTDVRVTPTQNVVTFFGTNTLINAGDTKRRRRAKIGEVFTFAADSGDLTGTRVTADKPITFLTGHECGFIPTENTACDILLEQIPPTETWGFQFVLTPLTTREGSGFKFLASQDGTSVKISCNDVDGDNVISESLSLNAGGSNLKMYPKTYWCFVESNRPILVVTISLGYTFDAPITESNLADPFMLMIPPLGQLSNDYTLVFSQSDAVGSFNDAVNFVPQINFIVPAADFDRGELILNNGAEDTSSINFIAIHDSSGEVAAYGATFVPDVDPTAPTSPFSARFSGRATTLGVLVYAWYRENTYGYPGGMRLDSIAVPIYCPISEPQPVGSETSGEILVPISRTGVAEGEACVQFEVGNGTAVVNEDYRVEDDMCCFEAEERTTECRIVVIADGNAEEDETLHFKIVPTADNCVCDDNLVVTIIKDVQPIMVEFGAIRYRVDEDAGTAELELVASAPAPDGGYNVDVSFVDGTAGSPGDYDNTAQTVNFPAGATTATLSVPIVDDEVLEHHETFDASLALPDGTPSQVILGGRDEAMVTILDDEIAEVHYDPDSYEWNESVGTGNLTIVSNVTSTVDYSVNTVLSNGTAYGGLDFVNDAAYYQATFAAGSSSAQVGVVIIDDTDIEEDEMFEGMLVLGDLHPDLEGRVVIGSPDTATITILDNEPKDITVQFDQTEYSVAENGGFVSLQLIADKPAPVGGYSVMISFADGSAAGLQDYDNMSLTVFFDEGQTTATVDVDIIDDTILERLETFTGQLSLPEGTADFIKIGPRDTATINITDNDAVEVNFDPTIYSVRENDGSVELILVANASASYGYSVTVETFDGTASDGSDYTGGSFEIDFPAGSTTASLTVPILDDILLEGIEWFGGLLTVSDVDGVMAGPDNMANVTITDNEGDIIVEFEKSAYSFNEDVGDGILTLVASAPAPAGGYSVEVSFADGTAGSPGDYSGATQTVFFPEGARSVNFSVPIVNDSLLEGNENFMANIEDISEAAADLGVKRGARDSAEVTITDNDSVQVNFSPTMYTVSEDGGSVELMLVASGPATFNYSVTVDIFNGTAGDGSDYTGGSFEVEFPAGSITASLTVPILEDILLEGNEWFGGLLSVSGVDGVMAGPDNMANVTILDNEGDIIVEFEKSAYSFNEDVGDGILTLVASAPAPAGGYSVEVSFADGTAGSPGDYDGATQTVSFPEGASSVDFSVPIVNDSLLEGNENFMANIEDISEAAADLGVKKGARDSAEVTITDNDSVQVNFSPTMYTVFENGGSVELMLVASGPATFNYSVTVDTFNGTAGDGSDYTGGSFEVEFPAGSTTASLTVPILEDILLEGNEWFGGLLSVSDVDGVMAGPDNMANVTITDNEGDIIVEFEKSAYSFNEDVGDGILTLVASAPAPAGGYSVEVSFADGTAGSPGDYDGVTQTVFFAEGASSVDFSVPIVNDSLLEGNENFMANIEDISEAAADLGVKKGARDSAEVTITDNDSVQVNFSPTMYTVSEDGGSVELMLVASGPAPFNYSVTVDTFDGTASDGSDYTGGSFEVDFPAGSTTASLTVPILEDILLEENEWFGGLLSVSGVDGVMAGPDNMANVTITDNEGDIIVEFEKSAYSFNEDVGDGILTLVANKAAPAGGYSVEVSFADGTAGSPGDYDGATQTVFFPEGARSVNFSVPIVNDSLLEGNENFMANIEDISEAAADLGVKKGARDSAEVTITDNDSVQVNFSPTMYTISEDGGSVELMLVTSGPAPFNYSVTVDTFDGTASDGSDYTGGSFEVDFPAGSTTASLTVDILDDNLPELDEWFGGLLSVSGVEGVTNGPQSLANVTISDEEEIFVQFDRAGYIFDEDVGDGILTLVADKPAPAGGYSVDVSFADGTAGSPGDYTGNTQSVFFPEGASSAQVAVPIFNDDFVEGDETFTAIIDPIAADGVRRGARNSTNVIIIDDEFIEINFDPTSYEVNEEDGTATLIIVADRPSSEPYTVNVVTSDGTAEDPIDYIGGIFLANFSTGETTTTVTIPITDDDIGECTEVFMAQLELPSGIPTPAPATPGTPSPFSFSPKYRIGSNDMATIKINDTDPYYVEFKSTSQVVSEDEESAEVCLVTNRECVDDFTIDLEDKESDEFTDKADPSNDYEGGKTYPVTFEMGKKEACTMIPIVNDGPGGEPDETFQLVIVPPPDQPRALIGNRSTTNNITITDGVDGDPMFTVPLNISKDSWILKEKGKLELCYEVHGEKNKIFNLVSDSCLSVNALLEVASNPKIGNVITQIGMIVMDWNGNCQRIHVDLKQRSLKLNNERITGSRVYNGILLRKMIDKVEITMPGCTTGNKLTFWIKFKYMNGADMLQLVISDGSGLRLDSHGLLGQFWNTPIKVDDKQGQLKQPKSGEYYTIHVPSAFSKPRSIKGEYYPLNWDFEELPCLYAGSQEGKGVIEGNYKEYETTDMFDPSFSYAQFSNGHCSTEK